MQTKAAPGSYSQAAWTRAAIASARRTPGRTGAVRCTRVSLPAGAAVRCSLSVRSAGATHRATLVLLRHRGTTYTLTLAGGGPAAAAFDAIARSFRFTA